MKLGILVNTDRRLEAVLGIAEAAVKQGHHVTLFGMDEGTRLLEQDAYVRLCSRPNIAMSFCEHSAERIGVSIAGLDPRIVAGSQYNNAAMMHEADKVIVL